VTVSAAPTKAGLHVSDAKFDRPSDSTGVLQQHSPFSHFAEAAEAALQVLQSQYSLGLWMVTRTIGDEWVVLHASSPGYDVAAGDVFRWADSFCSRMIRGEGPPIAPRANEIPAYREAAIGRKIPIGAYVGIPLTTGSDELFGTLCAIDPSPQPDSLRGALPLVRTIGRLLSTILTLELGQLRADERAIAAEADATSDVLTGVFNRRGFGRLLALQQEHINRYSSRAALAVIDLDDLKQVNDQDGHQAGDETIMRAAHAIAGAVRVTDAVARTGGDEFAVLMRETDAEQAAVILARIEVALLLAHVPASVGCAANLTNTTLVATLKTADKRMYVNKRARKLERRTALDRTPRSA